MTRQTRIPHPVQRQSALHPGSGRSTLQAAAQASVPVQRLSELQTLADQGAATQKMRRLQSQEAQTVGPQATRNDTGLPDTLKAGIETLSGLSMDGVKVHRNSPKPAQLQAHAYAQGRDIHLGPGQEQHLPHEAWHVVQQAQGRVRPTTQLKGVGVNDDPALEQEADMMGAKSLQMAASETSPPLQPLTPTTAPPLQREALARGKLNMVGENHIESGARRDKEVKMIGKYGFSEDQYLLENEFKFRPSSTADEAWGDPVELRAEHLICMLEELLTGLTDKFTEAGYRSTYHGEQDEGTDLWKKFKTLFYAGNYAKTLYGTFLQFAKDRDDADDASFVTLRDIALKLGPLSETIEKDAERPPFVGSMIIAKIAGYERQFRPAFIQYLGVLNRTPHKENAIFERSNAMHDAATIANRQSVVWKVGDRHISQIKDDINPGGNFDYNIVTMAEFNTAYKYFRSNIFEKLFKHPRTLGGDIGRNLGMFDRTKKIKLPPLPDSVAARNFSLPDLDEAPASDLLRYSPDEPLSDLLVREAETEERTERVSTENYLNSRFLSEDQDV